MHVAEPSPIHFFCTYQSSFLFAIHSSNQVNLSNLNQDLQQKARMVALPPVLILPECHRY